MIKSIILGSAIVLAAKASAATPSPLIGVWIEVNGPGMARIAPCTAAPDRLCATGLARRQGKPPAETGIVMSDIVVNGASEWRGLYHEGKRKLAATLRMPERDRVEMKVCIFLLCQSARYARAQ